MLLSAANIDSLLRQEPIVNDWPWNSRDETVIHQHIKDIIAVIRRKCRLLDKTEFSHYGSGYASYVDCWLYREDDEFRFHKGNCYWGLVVLFSTLSNYYVVGEGQKTWHKTGGSSYMPSFQFVDCVTHPATQSMMGEVCKILDDRGLARAFAGDLSALLARDIAVPTILADRPWRHFDALFYWED